MKTRKWAICLMLLTTLFTSTAQVFYKKGAEKLSFSLASIFSNYNLLIGFCFYIIGAILMTIALKGGDLTVLYPIIATSYIWVGIFSYFIFHDSLNFLRWFGIFSVFCGVICVAFGSKDAELVAETAEAL